MIAIYHETHVKVNIFFRVFLKEKWHMGNDWSEVIVDFHKTFCNLWIGRKIKGTENEGDREGLSQIHTLLTKREKRSGYLHGSQNLVSTPPT